MPKHLSLDDAGLKIEELLLRLDQDVDRLLGKFRAEDRDEVITALTIALEDFTEGM